MLETTTMGGGCFWCIEAILGSLKGVESVISGYAGGDKPNPTYHEVCSGAIGHAEVVQLTFYPSILSYAELLRSFLSMHNPTTICRQGADNGSQYRSVIFYRNSQQEHIARKVIAELEPFFEKKIVTEVTPYINFFKAEEHHQQYYKKDSLKAYCQSVITPKLNKMREHFKYVLKPVM
jgi:methionine-S-sulfoxide reductase